MRKTSKNIILKISIALFIFSSFCYIAPNDAIAAIDTRHHWQVGLVPGRAPIYGKVEGIEIDDTSDSIGALDETGDYCYGAGGFKGNYYFLPGFKADSADPEKDGDYDIAGFTTGDKVYFKLHKPSTGQEYDLVLASGKDYYTYKYTDNGDVVRVNLVYEAPEDPGPGPGPGPGDGDGDGDGDETPEDVPDDTGAVGGGLPTMGGKKSSTSTKDSSSYGSSSAKATGDQIYYYGPQDMGHMGPGAGGRGRPYTPPKKTTKRKITKPEPRKTIAKRLSVPVKKKAKAKLELPKKGEKAPRRKRSTAPLVTVFLAVIASLAAYAKKMKLF